MHTKINVSIPVKVAMLTRPGLIGTFENGEIFEMCVVIHKINIIFLL